jgi:hypothetical protein
MNGEGVAVDMHEAIKWYTQGAKAGNPYAQYKLGACYLQGTGVTADKSEAVKWLTLSAKEGDPDAQALLDKLV